MLDLVCSRCGKTYHADADKIGMSILCTTPFCSGLIPVVTPVGEMKLRHISNGRQGGTQPSRNLAWIAVAVLGGAVVLVGALVFRDLHHLGIIQDPIVVAVSRSNRATPDKQTGSQQPAVKEVINPPRFTLIRLPPQSAPAVVRSRQVKPSADPSREAAASEVHHYLQFPVPQPLQPVSALPVAQSSSQPPPTALSLPTGTDLATVNGSRGLSDLKIENGTGQDAVVNLVSSIDNKAYYQVYIQANDEWMIKKIAQGTYRLLVLQGERWNSDKSNFEENLSYREFDLPLTFVETTTRSVASDGRTEIETTWSHQSITLQKVFHGNVRTHPIDPGTFNAVR